VREQPPCRRDHRRRADLPDLPTVHLPDGQGAVRGDRPPGAAQPGGVPHAEAACDDQVPGGRLRGAVRALRGLLPAGSADPRFRGRERGRNGAVAQLALATGPRLQEFTYLLAFELPPLPRAATGAPIPFPVPSGITKGGKFRTTWIDYAPLAEVRQYVALD